MEPQSKGLVLVHTYPVMTVVIGALQVCPILLHGQSPASPKTPAEVLQAYRIADSGGDRLTAEGWYKASKYFIQPKRFPQFPAIEVLSDQIIGSTQVNGARATTYVRSWGAGQIDSQGRFTMTVLPLLLDLSGKPERLRAQQMYGPSAPLETDYDLVLTDTHWEFGPHGEGPRELKGPPEWRIETFDIEPWVTIKTAIRFLTKLHDTTSSDIIRHNCEKSIVALENLRPEGQHVDDIKAKAK